MESLWQSNTLLPRFSSLSGDIRTDVLVIGGGMAGLLTAYSLRRKGMDVVVAEKDRICSGTTAGTTAKITAQHGLIYHKIAKAYGDTYANMYYTANTEAVEKLKQLCKDAGCPLESKDNFVYSTDPRKLEAELSSGELSHELLMATSARITAIIESIEEKEMRWLELSEI